MKCYRIILVVLSILILSNLSAMGESAWPTIKQFMMTDTGAENKEYDDYLQSLNADELLAAAKDCAVDMESTIDHTKWDTAVLNLGFFFKYYPLQTKNLKEIDILIKDLCDKSQGKCWRHCLMQLLGTEWISKLDSQQSFDIAITLDTIFCDPSESSVLRLKAVWESADLMVHAYHKNFYDDPNSKKLLNEGNKAKEVLALAKAGKLKLHEDTVKMRQRIENRTQKTIDSQIILFADPNLPTDLRSKIISAWVKLNRANLKGTEKIKKVLDKAVKNYKKYDEAIWHQLVRTNIVYFENENAKPIVQEMIDQSKDQRKKKQLIRLKKLMRKKK
jgi:hypothetical protein